MLPALFALGAGAVVAASILVPLGVARENPVKPATRPSYMASALADSLPGALAYVDAGELYSAQPGSSPSPVSHVLAPSSSPQWSPDGQWIAYLGPRRGLHVVSLDGRQLDTGLGGPVVAMTWSPGENTIAFVQAVAESGLAPGIGIDAWYRTRTLWVESASGSGARGILGVGTGVAEPRFSPGGSEISFVTQSSIEAVPVSGGNASVLATGLSGALSTAGPDGYGKLPWGGLAIWGP